MNPLVASVIRTIVPAAVGQIGAWLALLGVPLTTDARVGLTSFLGFTFTAIYYLIVRVVEQQWPSFGILLGLPKSPDTYSKSVDTAAVPAAPTKGADNATGSPAAVYASADAPATPADDAPAPAVSFTPTQDKIDALPPAESIPEATPIVAPEVVPAASPAQ